MKKRILAMLLCLTMVGSMLPVGAIAVGETTPPEEITVQEVVLPEAVEETAPAVRAVCAHSDWTQWDGKGPLPTSGNIVLTGSVNLSDEYLLDGTTLSICLNGNNINAASGKRVFHLTNGAVLNIYDCDGNGKITGANTADRGAGVFLEKKSELNLHGGSICGNTTTETNNGGGGVSVAEGTFNMYGGSIADNTANGGPGGGIAAGTKATVNVTGGSITGNTAKNGGGIIVQGSNPTVLLEDCSITGNTGTANAGGVYVGYNAANTTTQALTLSGNLVVTGNVGGTGRIAANVQFMSDVRVAYQKELGANAQIGVRKNTGTEIITSGATAATAGNYISDSPEKIIKYENGKLYLADKPAESKAHANTAGYTSCNHNTTNWTGWYETGKLPTESGSYFLTGNVNLTDTWKVADGQSITICLNGCNITQSATGKRVIRMTEGTVKICDCTAKTENGVYTAGKITGANTSERGAGVSIESGSAFYLYDGCIDGNISSSYGGGVYLLSSDANAKSAFYMYGGRVSNNRANSQSGGGICTNGNTVVNITGGAITGNTANNGGAIVVQGNGNQVLLKDCAITGNTASNMGGGIYVGKYDSVTLSGLLNITGNTAKSVASNLFVCSTKTEERAVMQQDLNSDSTIGIGIYQTATSNVLVKSGATEQTVKCYIPDDPTKICKLENGKLLLVDKPVFTPNHADTQGYVPGDHGNVTWIDWLSTDSLPTNSGHYYLTDNVDLTKTWNAGDGKDITICLNGFNITQLTEGQRVLRVGSSTVNICDCTAHMDGGNYVAGKLTGGDTTNDANTGNAGAAMLTGSGTFRLYDGIFTGNHTDGSGVIVVQKGFVFEMHGGEICENTAGSYGAGVYVTGDGVFKLFGGQIRNNETASYGGGVYINKGVMEMTGGKICGNKAVNGGAVVIGSNGTFHFKDGSIEKNTATKDGGGMYVYGTFNMEGGIITENHADNSAGGGIAAGSGAKANITGGKITKNYAKNGGGMILQGTDPVVVLQDVSVTENEATDNGAGIYALYKVSNDTLKHLTLGGKVEITGNTVNGKPSNLLLGKDQLMHNNNLSKESVIGVGTTAQMPKEVVHTGGVEENLSCYVSDIYGRTFELRGEEIWMIVHPDAVHQMHEECGHEDVQWIEWANQTSLPTADGHYYLIADVVLSKAWNVGDGQEITLCLNGHSITQSADGLRVIRVAGSTLNICDCQNSGIITGGNTDASDNAGNAGAMSVLKEGTFRLYGGKITGNATEGNGTIVVQQNSLIEIHGGEISGNTAGKQGGAVYLSKSTMNMTGGSISGNAAEGSGAGVYNYGSTFTMSGGKISENESTAGGGGGVAIKNASDGTKAVMTLDGGEISGNISKLDGSGVRMDSGKFTMTGGKVSGNGTEEGAAGGLRLGDGEATISGGEISGNKGSNAAGVLATCDLTMTGGKICGNIGTGNGAGVYISGATFYFKGGEISGNQAGGKGAGVFLAQATMEMSGKSWILNNKAGGMGGGVATLGGTIRMTDGLIKDNVSGGGGGGIYTQNRTADDGSVTAETLLEISGGKIYGNSSKLMGGGIRMDDGKLILSGGEIAENKAESDVGGLCVQNGTAIITDCRIVKNTAGNAAGAYFNNCDVTMSGGLISTNIGGGNGAGVYVAGSTFKFSGGYIRFNESTGNGGGIFSSQSVVEISGGEIQGNRGGMGGGVYNYGGKLTVKGGIIKTNDAYKLGGGGIYSVNRFAEDKVTVTAEATLLISGGEITGNKAKTDGAGVRVDSGKFKMTDGLITANTATGSCGGMSLKDTDAVISGGKITKNKANNAAGVYITKGSLTISGGEISHNAGNGSGAGILASSADVKFSGGVIEENHAKGDGAGIYISNGKLTLCGGKIRNNRAEKICGGVLAAKNSRVYFTSGTVSGNTSKGSSGGMMIQTGSSLQMSGGTVSNNIAVNYGGGIYVNRNSSMTFSGGTVSGNAARKGGGGVYVGAESKFTMTGGTITKNDATTQGGGLTIVSDATISGGTISKNTSKREGAGFYISNATVVFSGGSVEENVTAYNGGGICVRGEKGILKISDDAKVLRNKCNESGGGILVQGNGKLEINGGEVSGNHAPNGGGGIRMHNCPAVIRNAKINENTSNGQGAGIYSNLSLILTDSEVCDNKIVADPNIKIARTSAAIRTYNESTLLMQNVKVTGNSCDGRAGAMEIAYAVDATVKNCTFADNTATERGGHFAIYREGKVYMEGCTMEGGSTDGNGGVISFDSYGKVELVDCEITGNSADMGGVAYLNTKAQLKLRGCTIKDNVAKSHSSVIWANGSVLLEDTVVTGNKDKGGNAAIYLNNEGEDTESYLPGVYEIIGNTTVHGNDGGDLVLVNNAFISIHGDGLGDDSKIQVKLQDADITRWVVGPYNYEASGDGFLLTKGEQSLSDAFMGSGEADSQETPVEEQQSKNVSLPLIISGGAAIVLLAVALGIAAVLRKKKAK